MTKMIDEIEHYLQEVAHTSSEKQGTITVFLPTVSVVIPTYNHKDMLRMQDLGFPGSSMWCDIDLAYRAYQQGFDFRRSTQARCWHRDYFAPAWIVINST